LLAQGGATAKSPEMQTVSTPLTPCNETVGVSTGDAVYLYLVLERARRVLTVETIKDLQRLEALGEEWGRLESSLSPRLPFASPLWALNWWRSFRRSGLAARDDLHCYALRDGFGALVALAPMFVTRRPGFGPIRARELQFFGADPYVTEWRGLVCRPEMADAAIKTLLAHIESERPADFVQWRGLPAEADKKALGANFQRQDVLNTTVFYLALPDSWEAFRGSLSRNVKESLRKCYNSLAREQHEFALRVVASPEEAPAALDVFFALHAMRADAQDTINHPNVFADESRRAFLRAYCDAMAKRDELRIFQLVIAEKIVATRIGFVLGDEIYLYFSGYDLAWSRLSVMTTTVAEAIKWSIGQKYRIFNLSTGSDVSKTRWRPESVEFHGGFSVGAGTGSLAFAAIHALRLRRSQKLRPMRADPQNA
jgi:CelD/BcsL family acetyltransferase involved in cellulose biosynthesis